MNALKDSTVAIRTPRFRPAIPAFKFKRHTQCVAQNLLALVVGPQRGGASV